MPPSQSGPLNVDQLLDLLGKVTTRLTDHKGGSGTRQPKTLDVLVEEDLRQMFSNLRDVLNTLVSDNAISQEKISSLVSVCETTSIQMAKVSEKVTLLEKTNRVQADKIDHHHQRSLRGKFTITPLDPSNLYKSPELEKSGKSLTNYVCSLIHDKFGLSPVESDIFSCHFSRKGIIFRLSNLSPTSLYSDMVTAIKTGQGTDRPIFFNFALTPKRAALLYELRKAKKGNKISRLFSDSDGTISYIPSTSSPFYATFSPPNSSKVKEVKRKITSIFSKMEGSDGFAIKTYTVEELKTEMGVSDMGITEETPDSS